jgi:hypothetical protein
LFCAAASPPGTALVGDDREPCPSSPAWAASIAAFIARRLVLAAILLRAPSTSSTLAAAFRISSMAAAVSSTVFPPAAPLSDSSEVSLPAEPLMDSTDSMLAVISVMAEMCR